MQKQDDENIFVMSLKAEMEEFFRTKIEIKPGKKVERYR